MDEHKIVVYPWKYAPDELKALSQHGGDEDWVIVMSQENDTLSVWSIVDALTICDSDRIEYNGQVVYITAHA